MSTVAILIVMMQWKNVLVLRKINVELILCFILKVPQFIYLLCNSIFMVKVDQYSLSTVFTKNK